MRDHGLPQVAVFENLDETQAGIVAALVAMDQRMCIQRNTVLPDQNVNRLQNKVQFKRWTQGIRQDLFRIGIQDGRQVAERAVIWDISDICQENLAWPMLFKFPIEQIVCNRIGADRLRTCGRDLLCGLGNTGRIYA